ncbi:MAG: DNA internalization-related competence protein ComEC/Rec2 [Clostridiales bacterium]|nr:DNA internalization-related competence protein ComEC/Rec2 [Clostridiales bacterium]
MIKRPLVWVLGATITGILLAWYQATRSILLILILIFYLTLFYLMKKGVKKYLNRQDWLLWFLPLFILLGFYAMVGQMEPPQLDRLFETKTDCRLIGTITRIVKKKSGEVLYLKDNTVYLSQDKAGFCENLIVYPMSDQNFRIGNVITVYGQIQKFSEATNPGQFNEKMYYRIENIDFKVMADEIHIRDHRYSFFRDVLHQIKLRLISIYEILLEEEEAGAIIAMLLGERYRLDEDTNKLYQQNGISHILSISGLHVSLIGTAIYKSLKRLKVPFVVSTLLSILFIYSYGVLTNFSISTVRSIIMMVLLLFSGIFGKTYDMLSSISLSAFLILLLNPLQIFHVGFLLSYGAVLGMAVLLPCFQIIRTSQNPIVSGFYVSISAQIATIPLLLYFFYQLPIYSVIINLIILPLSTLLVLAAFVAGIIGCIWLPFGVFCVGVVNYILKFYEWVCRLGAGLPGNLVTVGRPDWLRILLYITLILLFVWRIHRGKNKLVTLLLPVAILILIIPQRNVGLEITMLDVGQGEAIFMESKKGTTYLIDGGSSSVKSVGKYRIQPFLLSKGVTQIDYALVSHTDLDHVSGLIELITLGDIKIHHILLPYLVNKEETYLELESLAKISGINVSYLRAGDVLMDGELKVTCLHPQIEYIPSSRNSYSMVLSVTYGEFDLLLTGDLEQDGENILMAKYPYDYDVLKVAHHGSKNSTKKEFLSIIKPELALISCGKDNRYGHPHEELLDRLKFVESQVEITYEAGAITLRTDGERMEVERYLQSDNYN